MGVGEGEGGQIGEKGEGGSARRVGKGHHSSIQQYCASYPDCEDKARSGR